MQMMDLKDFIDLLYPFREKELDKDNPYKEKPISKGQFVRDLINNITPYKLRIFNDEDILKLDTISREKTIISHSDTIVNSGLDVKKFERYVKYLICRHDNVDELFDSPILAAHGIELSLSNYAAVLAEIFADILRKHAEYKTKSSDKSKPNTKPHSYNALLTWLDRIENDCQKAINLAEEFIKSEYYQEKINIDFLFRGHCGFVVKASETLRATKKAMTSNKVSSLIVHDFEKLMRSAFEENYRNLDDTYHRVSCVRLEDPSNFLKYEEIHIEFKNISFEIVEFEYMDTLKILAGEQN